MDRSVFFCLQLTKAVITAACLTACSQQPAPAARPQLLPVELARTSDLRRVDLIEPATPMPASYSLQACVAVQRQSPPNHSTAID